MTVDKMKLIQVVINLLTNASKFSSEDSEILFEVNEDSDYIVFKVKDQGIGLKEEDFSQLFTPFPDITVEGNYNRTGLGLSIAKGIVELHKGEIFAESKGVGKGSTFGFKIPKN
jgi:signal transduction histidine kinase